MKYLLFFWALLLPGLASAQTLTAPTSGAEVSIDSVTSTSMYLSFGNQTGDGQGRLVGIAQAPGGQPVPLSPTDNVVYPVASPAFGQGSPLGAGNVVYNGSGHSVVVTGLTPGTWYYVAASEWNASATAIIYNNGGTSVSTSTLKADPLPVVLTSFTGSLSASDFATLRWETASERGAQYFAVQRSLDGLTFTDAMQVPAGGTTTTARAYQWADPQRLAQPTYYRLRQVDLSGASTYSQVIALTPTATTERLVQVYPNPSNGQPVQLLLQGYAGEVLELRLTDELGRTVLRQQMPALGKQHVEPLPLPNLAPGSYLLTVLGSAAPVRKRLLLSK